MSPPRRILQRIDEDDCVLAAEDGSPAAIVSASALPLRPRREAAGVHHRPEFPGTAVRIGDVPYEVMDEQFQEDGRVVYALLPWPEHQLLRDQVVYGPAFVAGVRAARERAELSRRLWPLYPLIGVLPERWQLRVCDRWALDPLLATRVSSLLEAAGWILTWSAMPFGRAMLTSPLGAALVFMTLLRALGAFLTEEVSGQPILVGLVNLYEAAAGAVMSNRGPMTRTQFWARLATPDRLRREPDGAVTFEGALPHLTWTIGARVPGPDDMWRVDDAGSHVAAERATFWYRLVRETVDDAPLSKPAAPPSSVAYRDAVRSEVQREWTDLRGAGFGWLVSLLPADVQERATAETGGAPSLRAATLASVAFTAATAAWMALAPTALNAASAALLAAESLVRLYRVARGDFAPSLFGTWLPRYLRPERLAFRAHRDAERSVLRGLGA